MSDADLNGQGPILAAMESWRDAGVLDAPKRIDALSKSLQQQGARQEGRVDQLNKAMEALLHENALLRGELAGIAKSLDAIGRVDNRPPQPVNVPVSLNLSASGLAEQLGEVLSKSVADVIYKTLERAVSAPVTNVSMDVEALGKVIGDRMEPVLKSLSERPEPLPPSVDVAGATVNVDLAPVALALEKSIGGIVAQLSQPPAQVQVTVDTEHLSDVIGKAIGKSMERMIDKMQPQDLTPVLKRIDEGNAAVQKALAERNRPRQKRIGHDPDTGDLIVTEE